MNKDKKQAILDAALMLFTRQGYHATSTASVAKNAGVATGTLFHHFASKEELLAQLFLSVKQELADEMRSALKGADNLEQSAQDIWQAGLAWAMSNPNKQLFFQQFCMSPALSLEIRKMAMEEVLGFLGALLHQGQEAGVLAQFPLDLMLENCHGQFLATTQFFLDNPERWQQQEYRQACFRQFWQSIARL
ncbi:MAG: TetR/AcrR family transcriptional regulator [Shewanella sp.]|nr:TetR/AcrR family transcriptional regulator [Shewanella sp.]MCF1432069.1 TetR/AcrR family transcriptional regulator [Shewanella sp.]MCF1438867.1 TetR/AcrR family transcriptional regulator [Shewanella sp.]MCF1458147.1 TetR/AcrR family transcriptional regulator [Shewanella sp.]